MELKFNANEYLPLRDVVFQTLRQAIITGEIAPGERLMEIPLAKKLGVSRTPVREAIRMLELEGLVAMIPGREGEAEGSLYCFSGSHQYEACAVDRGWGYRIS